MQLVINGKLNPTLGLIIRDSLDLQGTQITKLPEGLSVGGSLDLQGTQITNYPVVYDCGNSKRAIYLNLKDKTLIHIGCFVGTKDEAIDAIKDKYDDGDRDAYITKVNECFELINALTC